jgi:hypothetical protein
VESLRSLGIAAVLGSLYPWTSSADLLNLVVPTRVIGLGGQTFASISSHFPSNYTERPSYLGLPALLIVGLLLVRRPWPAATRVLAAVFAVATFVSFGTALWVDGNRLFWLPWSWPSHWTGLKDIAPDRFALYSTLAADVMGRDLDRPDEGEGISPPVRAPGVCRGRHGAASLERLRPPGSPAAVVL